MIFNIFVLMMDLVDYINELLDIVYYMWFFFYYVRLLRYYLDNENDMIFYKLFVVLVWFVINFLGKGWCEMFIEDLYWDVLEFCKLFVEMIIMIVI